MHFLIIITIIIIIIIIVVVVVVVVVVTILLFTRQFSFLLDKKKDQLKLTDQKPGFEGADAHNDEVYNALFAPQSEQLDQLT